MPRPDCLPQKFDEKPFDRPTFHRLFRRVFETFPRDVIVFFARRHALRPLTLRGSYSKVLRI